MFWKIIAIIIIAILLVYAFGLVTNIFGALLQLAIALIILYLVFILIKIIFKKAFKKKEEI